MKHKILSVLLVLAMLLTLLPMSVFATEPAQVAWSFLDGVLTVSEADVEVDIPDYTAAAPAPWTLADTESGYDPLSVTEIVIAEGVKSVGENAFAGLDNVTKITLPKSVTTVGAGALPTQMQALQIKFDESTTVSFDGTDAVVLPTEREGYASSWNGITLSRDTALVDAAIVFTPVTYTVTFAADGIPVDMTGMDNTFTVEDTTIDVPEVPAKTGYTAAWETYTLGASDLTVNAVYTPITYYATFMNGEDEVDKVEFTVETTALEEPAVPEKEGFNGAWESYTLGMEDITVRAVYTLATYTVTFEADGTVVGTDTYTIEDRSVTAPTVPAKAGYKAAWETYTLGASDLTVKAKYTPITYYATFVADGKTVAKVPFTVESTSITAPAVPEKEGFDGKWKSYTLGTKNITVKATYTFKSYTASTTASYLNVRSGPGTSYGLKGGLSRGSKITIVEEKADASGAMWGKTSTGGWLSLTYVQKIAYVGGSSSGGSTSGGTSTATKYKATVTASSLNVRSGPGTGYGIKGSLARGASVTFTEQKTVAGTVWCKLTNGGWISKAYLTNIKAVSSGSTGGSTSGGSTSGGSTGSGAGSGSTSGGSTDTGFKSYTATVSVSSILNVRKGAGTGYAVVSYLTNGAKVTVTAERVSGGTTWAKISTGWISKAYLKNIKPTGSSGGSTSGGSTSGGTTSGGSTSGGSTSGGSTSGGTSSGSTATRTVRVTASSLNIRSGAGTGYSVVGSLYNGQTAKIVQTKGIWGKTSAGGWICMTYTVDVVTPPPVDIEGEFTNIVSTYTGNHVGSVGRNINLSLACQAINGTILAPGASFSFNGVVGQRTAAKGYQIAPIIGGSGYSYGGGVCQVASILFNTALEANFEITERWQHYAAVDYVPRGRDAAINWGSQDLRFVNNSEYVYKIEAHAEGGTVTVTLRTREDVSTADDVSLKVVKSGNRYTLYRYYNGEVNYSTVSIH